MGCIMRDLVAVQQAGSRRNPAPGTKLRDKWLWEMPLRGAGRGKLLPKTRGFRYDSAPGGDWLRRVWWRNGSVPRSRFLVKPSGMIQLPITNWHWLR